MVVLGLGSNLGDRLQHLQRALREIFENSKMRCSRVFLSGVYESKALLPKGAPRDWDKPFLNMAVRAETSLHPAELLFEIKQIEKKMGRETRKQWAPREIDIDILALDQKIIHSDNLSIPHPGLLERSFALRPFSEVANDWVYPVVGPQFGKSPAQILSETSFENDAIKMIDHFSSSGWVGILNITPDSFSDGEKYRETPQALARARQLAAAGAAVLDLGAESTRPGARGVPAEEEWGRLEPVLESLVKNKSKSVWSPCISVDTRKWEVAKKALEAGADWINDVTGLEDPKMRQVLADSHCDVVMMHHLGVPPTNSQIIPRDLDPVSHLLLWAESRLNLAEKSGIHRSRIIFDPGIGFGKTAEQSLDILFHIRRFRELGVRLLVGHSRKSFLKIFGEELAEKRDPETSAISEHLVKSGVDYIRVHNLESNIQSCKAAMAFWT